MTTHDRDDLQYVTVAASAQDIRTIASIRAESLPEQIQQMLASEGIHGAYRNEDGRVVIVDRTGDEVVTAIEISPDGHVLDWGAAYAPTVQRLIGTLPADVDEAEYRQHIATGTTIRTGHDAIEYAETHGLTLRKYADPTEDARDGLTVDEAREVAAEDPGLIYIEGDANYYAVIDKDDVVVAVHTDTRNATHVQDTLADLAGSPQGPRRWVYVEEPCRVGDQLEVDEDGCAVVVGGSDAVSPRRILN